MVVPRSFEASAKNLAVVLNAVLFTFRVCHNSYEILRSLRPLSMTILRTFAEFEYRFAVEGVAQAFQPVHTQAKR